MRNASPDEPAVKVRPFPPPPAEGWAAWSAARGYTRESVARHYAEEAGLIPAGGAEDDVGSGAFAGDVLVDNEFSFVADDGYVLPYAGREAVYNITVEDTHTYIADGWLVHNDSLEWRAAGEQFGGLLASQLYQNFGGDNVAFGLAA